MGLFKVQLRVNFLQLLIT